MSQAQDIIQSAYRELNLIAIGKTLSTAQITEGLQLLNQAYTYAIGTVAGEFYQNWLLGNYGLEDIYIVDWNQLQLQNPPANVRLVMTAESSMTVWFPPYPSDGARMAFIDPHSLLSTYPILLDGNSNLIEGSNTKLLDTNAISKEWLYRADLGNWLALEVLEATDTSPFPDIYDQFFSLLVSLRLSPRSGVGWSAETTAFFKAIKMKFQAQYIQRAPLKRDPSLDWMSRQSYTQFYPYPYGSQSAFNTGWAWWGPGW